MTKSYINYKEMLIRAYCFIYINKQFIKEDEIIYDDYEKGVIISIEKDEVIRCKFNLKVSNTKNQKKSRVINGVIKLTEGDLKFMLESLVNNYIY